MKQVVLGSLTQGATDSLVNDAVNKIKNDNNIMKPNEFKKYNITSKNEIKSSVDSMINVVNFSRYKRN